MTFLQNMEWRNATKKFDGKKIPADALETIKTAIRMAPTSFGIQPFHVTIVTSDTVKAAILPLAWNQEQITTCSHLFVFSTDTDLETRTDMYVAVRAATERRAIEEKDAKFAEMVKGFAKQMGEEWATRQEYIALGFAMAACAELSIDSCPMEGANFAEIKKVLGLPEHLNPKVMLAVGYRTADHAPTPKVRFGNEDLFDAR